MIKQMLISALLAISALVVFLAIIAIAILAGAFFGGQDAPAFIIALFVGVALCGAVSGLLSWLEG